MLDFNKLFKLAKERGIEDIQIGYSEETSKEINYTDKELDSFSINTNTHFGAKGIYKGKMGSYSTEVVKESEFDTIVSKIIESASFVTNDDEVFIYEGDKEYPKLKNEYNENLSKVSIKDKIKLCETLALKMLEKPYVTHTESGYAETEVTSVMANSKGLNLLSHSNYFQIYSIGIVSKDNDTRNSYSIFSSNDYSKIDVDGLVNEAYEDAYKSIGAKPIESKEYEAVLSESATATLLNVFEGVFSSERAQKNLSILKGRVNEKIASDAVTIVDNPLLEGSSSATPFDTDGVSTSYKEVVKDGVFTGFVYNLKTAKKEGVKSTGNATGSSCSLLLPYFKPGKRSKKEIIKDIKDGVYITGLQGAHAGANEMSLDFSLQATGYTIKDGILDKPVALITISANYLDMLKDVIEVSNELKNTIEMPALRIRKISVSGV